MNNCPEPVSGAVPQDSPLTIITTKIKQANLFSIELIKQAESILQVLDRKLLGNQATDDDCKDNLKSIDEEYIMPYLCDTEANLGKLEAIIIKIAALI